MVKHGLLMITKGRMKTMETNEKIILTYIGKDFWSRPTFKINGTGYYVKDINLANNIDGLFLHWSCPKDNPDGEPDYPFKPKEGIQVEIVGFNPISEEDEYNYMLLGRYQSDCEAHLGVSNRKIKDIKNHIQMMKELWNSLEVKPLWLSMEQILEYERLMNTRESVKEN